MRRRSPARWAAALAVATSVALATSLASAGETLRDESVRYSIEPGADIERSAACRGDAEVVSGGFFTGLSAGTTVLPLASDWDNARKWNLRTNNIGPAPGEVIGYAYCADPPIVGAIRPGFGKVAPGAAGSAQRRCRTDHGEFAVAGGFEVGAGSYVLTSKMLDARTWTAEAFNPTQNELSISTDVSCDIRKSENPVLTHKRSAPIAGGETRKVLAECEPRQKLLSGGFEVEPSTPAATGYALGSRRRAKRGWQATAHAEGGAVNLTAYAYCSEPGAG